MRFNLVSNCTLGIYSIDVLWAPPSLPFLYLIPIPYAPERCFNVPSKPGGLFDLTHHYIYKKHLIWTYLATPSGRVELGHSGAILARALFKFSARMVTLCVWFSVGLFRVLPLLIIATHLNFCHP